MGRVKTIDDEKLLQVAREVFLEQGFNAKATDIAVRAGISSGSIFRRYPDKESLFLATMETQITWIERLNNFDSGEDLKQTLERIAKMIFEDFKQTLPCQVMVLAQKLQLKREGSEQVNALASFLDKELELGRLRPSLDTWVTAKTIIGAIHYLAWLEATSPSSESSEGFIEGFIDTLWKGIIANPESY